MATEKQVLYKKAPVSSLLISSIFTWCILLITWFLYWYNASYESKNIDLQRLIDNQQSAIDTKQSNEKLRVYNLISKYTDTFKDLEYKSKIYIFDKHFI